MKGRRLNLICLYTIYFSSLQSRQNSSSDIQNKNIKAKSINTNHNTNANTNKPIENNAINNETPKKGNEYLQPSPRKQTISLNSTTVFNNETPQVESIKKEEKKLVIPSINMNNLNVNNNPKIDEEDSKSKRNTFMSNKNNNSDFSITHVVAANDNNSPLVNSTNNIVNAKEENPLTCQDLLNVLQGNDEEEKHSIKVNESDNLEYDTEELNKAKNEANKEEQFSLNQDEDDEDDE